jgi:hypothetical protein
MPVPGFNVVWNYTATYDSASGVCTLTGYVQNFEMQVLHSIWVDFTFINAATNQVINTQSVTLGTVNLITSVTFNIPIQLPSGLPGVRVENGIPAWG